MKCHTGNTKIDWSDLKENFFYDVGIVMVFLNLIVVLTLSLLIKLPLKIVDLIRFKFLSSKISVSRMGLYSLLPPDMLDEL